MSMSTHIVGFRPPDDLWNKMRAIWDACDHANIAIPPEVLRFFNYEPPDAAGVLVRLEGTAAVNEYSADMSDGFEIDVAKLPPGLTIIRVYNSY
jgi:hypothetical protein